MAGAADRRVVLARGAGDSRAQDLVRSRGNGIGVGEGAQERLFEALQALPGSPVGLGRGIVWLGGDQHWELARPLLVAILGEPRVGRGPHRRIEIAHTSAVDDASNAKLRGLLAVALPGQKRVARFGIAGGAEGVR